MPAARSRPAKAAPRAKKTAAPAVAEKPLRIVARLHAYPPRHNAGAEWMVHTMLRSLVDRGHRVQVWLSRYSRDREVYTLDGVEVVPLLARADLGAAVRQADVVLSHLECVPSTAALARGYGRPMVVVCHNTHTPTFRAAASGQVALAVYNSLWMQGEAEVYFAEHPSATRPEAAIVVRPPVRAVDYATTPGDRVTLVNCCPEKGGEVLRELAKRLPDTKFLAVRGAYGDQVDYSSLPNVEVVDHVDGQRMRDEVYARSRVVLMPSSYESWGRVGVEALASGIPVLAAPTPGLMESLGDAGIFVDRNDLEGWVQALTLLEDQAEWEAASKRALARSAELDPAAELAAWCEAVEATAARG
jgi:glycosyltransferase involved in cell wall biosynthesis